MSTPMFDVPEHLPMALNEQGQGPETEDAAVRWGCWCGTGCPLDHALHQAGEAGMRRLVLSPGLEESIAHTLAKRHKCLDHNGPGSGPCKTDKERAALVVGSLVGRMLAMQEETK